MANKFDDYKKISLTAYKGTRVTIDITIIDIDFSGSGSFIYTFEGNDTVVLENPIRTMYVFDGLGNDNYTLIESPSFDYNSRYRSYTRTWL